MKKEYSRFKSSFGNKMLLMKKTDSSMSDSNKDSHPCLEWEEKWLLVLPLYYLIDNF